MLTRDASAVSNLPKRQLFYLSILVTSAVCALAIWPKWVSFAFSSNYLPHRYCYLAKPGLIWSHVIADCLIGLAYVAISGTLGYLVYKGRREIPFHWMFLAFGLFIVACGGTHFMEDITVWIPVYVLSAGLKIFTAIVSVATASILPSTVPKIISLIQNAKTVEENQKMMVSALKQRDLAQKELSEANAELERRVRDRTMELELANSALQAEIEDRIRIEKQLVKVASVVEFSNDAILTKTLDGIVMTWNKAAERTYGYKAEEIIGKPVSMLSPEDRADEIHRILSNIARGEVVEHHETTRVKKDGGILDVSLTISPIKNLTGEITGASVIARDITERKQSEAALRQSEQQYRLLFDSCPLPMWVYDHSTLAFLAVNDAAIQHYGYSQKEFLSMTILDIRPEDEVSDLLSHISVRTKGLQPPEIWQHRKKDESIIDVEVTSHELAFKGRDAQLVLANDITERLRAAENLRDSEERFSKAFSSSPLAITIATLAEGRYVDVNDAFLEMMEYSREEVVGRTSHELGFWEDFKTREAMVAQLAQTGRIHEFEAQLKTRTGEIKLGQIAAETIQLGKEPCILAMIHDITEARRLEEQFRQAQKMEAVGRLAGGIAHDFNNMLGVILGYSDLSRERLPKDSLQWKHNEQIRKAALRASALTRQLLAFSRQQILQPSTLNLNAVVNNASKMLLRVIGEDISLHFVPGEKLGSVQLDLGQIEQVLMNLVVNARDAMPRGGKIVIETANAELDETYAQSHLPISPGAYVMLAVTDTGTGIEKEALSRIFEPFFTTKPVGVGTGLGLSMVYGVVRQSGGNIWVYSEPGKGTTFKMYFPRVEESAESLIESKSEVVLATGSETILLVEDEEDLRELTGELLKSAGYRVLAADSGQKSMEISRQHEGDIHLLLTDVIMPGMGGSELAALLKESRPELKVLYMSGYTGNLIANYGVVESESALIQKPFTKQALLNQVRSSLDAW